MQGIRDIFAFCFPEDIHIYSIDEAFLDITHYIKYYNASPQEIARKILDAIYEETGLPASCGVGDNIFLAKVALDCLAKRRSDNIAYLDKDLFRKYIWDLRPLDNIWGIGRRLSRRLAALNIRTLRDLARTPPEKLEKNSASWGLNYIDMPTARTRPPSARPGNIIPKAKLSVTARFFLKIMITRMSGWLSRK